jgi:sugar/nucleoside kinase (ribokinase family)
MTKTLVAGELNVDLILQGYRTFPTPGKEVLVDDCTLTLGSASAICARGLARLGNQVAFLGKVGSDSYGDFCIQTLKAAGIDVSHIIRDPSLKTGITVSISSPSDRALVTYLGAIIELRGEDISNNLLKDYNHLHISSYFMQEKLRPSVKEVFARAHQLGLTTSLDPGFDPSETWASDLEEVLLATDIFFPNEVEASALTGRADPAEALRVLENGHTQVVLKLGREGCMALDKGVLLHQPAFPVKPVDTTGAGDSFNAGFLHAWFGKRPLRECLRYGAASGALSTLGLGGIGAQPSREELEDFLEAQL